MPNNTTLYLYWCFLNHIFPGLSKHKRYEPLFPVPYLAWAMCELYLDQFS